MSDRTETVPVPNGINELADGTKIKSAKQATMLTLLGNPRANPTSKCGPLTNQALKLMMVTSSVGPFRVTGLKPAVDSLRSVMTDVFTQHPDIHAALGTAGMLCARLVVGSATAISNHSWGTAVDLTLDGVLDKRGDGRVQRGLLTIAPIFNKHGWYWGAAFGTEDAMHFEVSDGQIRNWHAAGKFSKAPSPPDDGLLMIGDRGPDVREMQERLNVHGAMLIVDGEFGNDTQAAVLAFQGRLNLPVTGVVDAATMNALSSGKGEMPLIPAASSAGMKVKKGK